MKQRKEKGITLIALVITIIVLLILVAISISTLTGENGILSKANTAKTENEKAGAKEKVQIAVMGSFDENGAIDVSTLKNNLKGTEGVTGADSIIKLPATVNVDGYDVSIDEKGNVTLGSIEEQGEAIFARLYTKNGSEEEVLVFASNENVFPDYSGELTIKKDCGNINITKVWTYEDLLNDPEYGEYLKSEEWKNFEKENPEEAKKQIEYLIYQLNSGIGNMPPWLEESLASGYNYGNYNLCEVRILDEVKPIFTVSWFEGCRNLKKMIGIENLNTTNVVNMGRMFHGCDELTELNLSSFKTSNVIDMNEMFSDCKNLTKLNVSNFNTSNVIDMRMMFFNCNNLTQLNLTSFDTSNVTDMGDMFSGCNSLTELNLSNFNTSNVTYMGDMFGRCNSLTELNLSNFNTSNVTNMTLMFRGCKSLTQLNVSNFNTSNVTNMFSMFSDCNSITQLDLSSFNTSNVTDMRYMFSDCKSLTQILVSEDWKEPTDASKKGSMFSNCGVTSVTIKNP